MKGLVFDITGFVAFIGKEQQITERFSKRTFKVLVPDLENEQYSDVMELELKNDKCYLIDKFAMGELVRCKCGLSGRDWVSKDGDPIYDKQGQQINSTTINCWYIVPGETGEPEDSGSPMEEQSSFPGPEEEYLPKYDNEFDNMGDDLPF